jgi:hypothetical protein
MEVTMRIASLSVLLVIALVVLSALSCSDSSGPEIRGTLAFTYTGAGGGTYSASGDAPALPAPTGTSWAAGYVRANESFFAGSTPRSGVLIDLAMLRAERTTPGSENIDPACNIDGSTSCTGMDFYLNFNGDGDTGDFFCTLTSGTIVLTQVSSSRAKGTFSGSGSCVDGTGGGSEAFEVSNGAFDVALIAPPG